MKFKVRDRVVLTKNIYTLGLGEQRLLAKEGVIGEITYANLGRNGDALPYDFNNCFSVNEDEIRLAE